MTYVNCPVCDGVGLVGEVGDEDCPACEGFGTVTEQEAVKIAETDYTRDPVNQPENIR